MLGPGDNVQPPEAALSRGLEVHPAGDGSELELWIDPRYVDAGYGWSFPARDEVRIGVGSFDPHDPVKQPTLRLVEDVDASPDGYQGNWIPHRLRPAAEDGVFFAGDRRGPLPAADRRGHPDGVLLRDRARARAARGAGGPPGARARALARYGAFSASHKWKFEAMYAAQQSIRHLHGRPLDSLTRVFARPRVSDWAFAHYLEIAPPSFAVPAPPGAAARRCQTRAMAA